MAPTDLPPTPDWYEEGETPFIAHINLEDLGYGIITIQDASKPRWTKLGNMKDGIRRQACGMCWFITNSGDSGKFPEPLPPHGKGEIKAWESWVENTPMRVYSRIERATLLVAGFNDPLASSVRDEDG